MSKKQFRYNATASAFILLTPYCSSISIATTYVESSTNALLPHIWTFARQDPEMVAGVDLLVPGIGELCGGSLRESSPEAIAARWF